MRNIEVDIPFEILIADQSSLQNQLNTGITHITQVNEITGVTNRRRCIQRKQHITGFPIEIIQATAQASAEKIKFCTYIPVCIGFPSNITGTFLTPLVSSLIIIIYHFVRIGIQIITDIVITLTEAFSFKEFTQGALKKASLEISQAPPTDQKLPQRCSFAKREEASRR